jgi:hypothetical protein
MPVPTLRATAQQNPGEVKRGIHGAEIAIRTNLPMPQSTSTTRIKMLIYVGQALVLRILF